MRRARPPAKSTAVSNLTDAQISQWLVREQLATIDAEGRRVATQRGLELAAAITWQLEGSGRRRGRLSSRLDRSA